MHLRKCPRCELNYIREDEKYCNVCRREMKGEPEIEEVQMCIECGENPVSPGKDRCSYCMRELQRREKLEKLMECPTSDELVGIDVDELNEIDMPAATDIPSDELQEIHREFGDNEEEDSELIKQIDG